MVQKSEAFSSSVESGPHIEWKKYTINLNHVVQLGKGENLFGYLFFQILYNLQRAKDDRNPQPQSKETDTIAYLKDKKNKDVPVNYMMRLFLLRTVLPPTRSVEMKIIGLKRLHAIDRMHYNLLKLAMKNVTLVEED